MAQAALLWSKSLLKCQQAQLGMQGRALNRFFCCSRNKHLLNNQHLYNQQIIKSANIRSFQPVRYIQTSKPRHVNPVLVAVLRPLSKIVAALVGRGVRKWWQSLPKHKRQLFTQHLRRNARIYAFGSVMAASGGYSYYDTHVTRTPLTGRRRFMVFTPEQLQTISKEMYQEEMHEFREQMMPASDPMVQQVSRVGNRLLQANRHIPQLYTKTWTVTVIDSDIENCFVLPSGDIVMFKGMMYNLANDDQVAMVLAHEMSHAILEHGGEQLSHGYLMDMLILLPLAVVWAFIPSDGIAAITHWFLNKVVHVLLNLPYSRAIEEEADTVGLMLAATACYDVREASAFWGMMSASDKILAKDATYGDIDWLSTHPSHSARQETIDSQLDSVIQWREKCQCPKLSPEDPRNFVRYVQKIVKAGAQIVDNSKVEGNTANVS